MKYIYIKKLKVLFAPGKTSNMQKVVNTYNVAEIFYLHKQCNEPGAFNFILL